MLTDEDIRHLTKPTPFRSWMDSNDPRPYEEYKLWWESVYGTDWVK